MPNISPLLALGRTAAIKRLLRYRRFNIELCSCDVNFIIHDTTYYIAGECFPEANLTTMSMPTKEKAS